MKIKLANQQSRRRIQELNSRLKVLASDVHGQEKPNSPHFSPFGSGLSNTKLTKKNYFKSASNLNLHHQDDLFPAQINRIENDQSPNRIIGPASPKFSTSSYQKETNFNKNQNPLQLNSPKHSNYTSSSQLASKNQIKAKKQLKEIIQSKKSFHSLIKKELSELEKLEQMMIEQPQNWDDKVETGPEMKIVGERNRNPGQKNVRISQKEESGPQNISIGSEYIKTKTEQSMQESMGHQIEQSRTNNQSQLQMKVESPLQSVHSSEQSQQFFHQATHNSHSISPDINKEQEAEISFNHKQAEELLKEIMIVDYSEDNIQSILRLVEEESVRRSKKGSLEGSCLKGDSVLKPSQNPSIISQSSANSRYSSKNSSILSKNNSAIFSKHNADQIKEEDHIKQQLQEEKHYRLIHSYKLMALVLKIKYFAKVKTGLSSNLIKKRKQYMAENHCNKMLVSKAFTVVKNNAKESISQQLMLYRIKTIYTHNMLKKNALRQMLFNSKHKAFKFLSAKLSYQQQLKTKSFALSRMLSSRQQQSKYQEINKLSEQLNKKSLFKTIKERHLETRETHAKYKLLKNLIKHRNWNAFVRTVRFDWIKNIVRSRQEETEINLVQRHRRSFQLNQSEDSIGPSSVVEQLIISGLNSYTELFTSHMSQVAKSPGQSQIHHKYLLQSSNEEHQSIMEFSQPIVLHLKKSILNKFLTDKLKQTLINRFVQFSISKRQHHQNQLQIHQKQYYIVQNVRIPNYKAQFIQNLSIQAANTKLNKKISYFCNITLGKVPQTIKFTQLEEINQSTQQQANPLMVKHFKHVFMRKLRQFSVSQNQKKLQSQVYYETIYGRNVLKRHFVQWKSSVSQLKTLRYEQQLQERQTRRQTQKLEEQKMQQQMSSKHLKQQQIELQQQQNRVKQNQNQLNLAESRLRHQQSQIKQKQMQIKQKLTKLSQQEEEISKLERIKIQQLQTQTLNIERQKQKLYQQAGRERQILLREEMQMKERLEMLKNQERQRQEKLRDMEAQIQMKKRQEMLNKVVKRSEENQQKDIIDQDFTSGKQSKLERNAQSNISDQESKLLSNQQSQEIDARQSIESVKGSSRVSNRLQDREISENRSDKPQQSQENSESQNESDPSQNSQQILAEYLAHGIRPSPTSDDKSASGDEQPQDLSRNEDKSQNEDDSPHNMDDIMDWLGDKIGIQQSSHLQQGQKSSTNRKPNDQPLEQNQIQQNDQLFANLLNPQQKKLSKNHISNDLQINKSRTSSVLDESNISHNQSSPKNPTEPQEQASDQSQQQLQEEASEGQQSSQSQEEDLSSSTSSTHLRLLTYAQNHHKKHITHLIFSKVFKQKIYQQQQNHERKLLTTVFSSWKAFYLQKKSLQKYLDIYEQIQGRISHQVREADIKSKRESRSLSRRKNNENSQRYMSGSKTNKVQETVKYYPTSKEQKQQFQNLYNNQ